MIGFRHESSLNQTPENENPTVGPRILPADLEAAAAAVGQCLHRTLPGQTG